MRDNEPKWICKGIITLMDDGFIPNKMEPGGGGFWGEGGKMSHGMGVKFPKYQETDPDPVTCQKLKQQKQIGSPIQCHASGLDFSLQHLLIIPYNHISACLTIWHWFSQSLQNEIFDFCYTSSASELQFLFCLQRAFNSGSTQCNSFSPFLLNV